jgi:oxepin-CoA hydrolase / 3-oxo-5,6-dehydrosuberyl-CoA semialdehyde dehydrogenase
LREMTFHERAALAKAAGQLLREHREELYELSYRTGATLADSKFDIDGGIGVLLSYARAITASPYVHANVCVC